MAQVSSYVPAPFQGITQASPQIALLEQATTLDNILVDVPEGLRKRPPFDYRKKLFNASVLHTDAQYVTLLDPDTLALMHLVLNRESGHVVPHLYDDATLTAQSITIDAGAQTYLDINTPTSLINQLRISQVVDYTIITNRTAIVGVNATLNPARPPEAILFCKAGAFGRKFTVTVTPSVGSPIVSTLVTPDGDDASDALHVGTDAVIDALFNVVGYYPHNGGTQAPFGAALTTAGITWTLHGAFAYLTAAANFTMTCTDDSGGLGLGVVQTKVTKFSDLPAHAVDGFTVEIAPVNQDNSTGGYWVQYSGNDTTGLYKEALAPGAQLGLDPTTMPVGLIKLSGVWHLLPLDWKGRTVGNETKDIDPGFVGTVIHDIGYSFGRLNIISSEEVFMAAADDPFRCYPASLVTAIDSDPFDLQPPGPGKALYRTITPFLDKAVVLGRKQQSALLAPGDGPVTPSTCKLKGLSTFEITDEVPLRPPGVAGKAYFASPLGSNHYQVRELATDRVSGLDATEDLTASVPELLPNTLDRACSVETAYAAIYGSSGSADLYVHLFRYSEQQRVQNGWFHWTLPTGWTLVGLSALGTKLFAMVLDPAAAGHLISMETTPRNKDSSTATMITNWDLRFRDTAAVSEVYDSFADTTTITVPSGYPITTSVQVSAKQMASSPVFPEGYRAEVVSRGATTVTIKHNWTAQDYYVGYQYAITWTPNLIQYFSPQDNRPMHSGVLRVDSLSVDVSLTGNFIARVTVGNRPVHQFALGDNLLGSPPLFTGSYRIPIGGYSNKVSISFISSSHMPLRAIGFEWFGDYNPKARRTS